MTRDCFWTGFWCFTFPCFTFVLLSWASFPPSLFREGGCFLASLFSEDQVTGCCGVAAVRLPFSFVVVPCFVELGVIGEVPAGAACWLGPHHLRRNSCAPESQTPFLLSPPLRTLLLLLGRKSSRDVVSGGCLLVLLVRPGGSFVVFRTPYPVLIVFPDGPCRWPSWRCWTVEQTG